MMKAMLLGFLAFASAGLVSAQRPSNVSICDYYTPILFGENTATNQYKLLSALVSRAVVGGGQTGQPTSGTGSTPQVTGIVFLEAQKPFFNSTINYRYAGSPNAGEGAAPNFIASYLGDKVEFNKLANKLIGFFGAGFGCSKQGTAAAPSTEFPAYGGSNNMEAIHRGMPITQAIFSQFNGQIADTAQSYGVSDADRALAGALLASFGRARTTTDGPVATSICNQADCSCAAGYTNAGCTQVISSTGGNSASTIGVSAMLLSACAAIAMLVRA